MAMSRLKVKYGFSAMIISQYAVWSCQATQELWLVDIVTFPDILWDIWQSVKLVIS